MPLNRRLSRRERINMLLAAADASAPKHRPPKKRPPKKRGPMRDNSRNIAVHMTEEQYQRLQEYMRLTRHEITLYFRKLIHGDEITGSQFGFKRDFYAGVNMIHSNVQQIARNPYARKLDADAVDKLEYLAKKLGDEVFYLSCYK